VDYICCRFYLSDSLAESGIIVAELADLDFESFMEHSDGVEAYIQKDVFHDVRFVQVIERLSQSLGILSYEVTEIPHQNWNAQWESDYAMVQVGAECVVYAPFHQIDVSAYRYPILISPKMSFGTGHHQTTELMLQAMLNRNLIGKAVLDMGCGTAVLAILAAKMGASGILAIDIEAIAAENSVENAALNNVNIDVQKGDASIIGDAKFDLILANINRNILLADMKVYANALTKGGSLFLSGFFESDIPELQEAAAKLDLNFCSQHSLNSWAMLDFLK